MARVRLKVGVNSSGHELATSSHTHTKLKCFGAKEIIGNIGREFANSDASDKTKDDVPNDDRPKVTIVVFWYCDPSARGKKLGHGVRYFSSCHEVEYPCELVRGTICLVEPCSQS